MGSAAFLIHLEAPLASYSLETPVTEVLLAGLNSPTDYWPALAIGWLAQGAVGNAEVLAALGRVSENRHFAQSVRHRAAAILRRNRRSD